MNALDASCVLVRVHGPDPTGKKAEDRAFYNMENGLTTLSASGFVCRRNSDNALVAVTCASVVAPFLQAAQDGSEEFLDELMVGASVHCYFENSHWVRCHLGGVVRLRRVVEAAEGLVGSRVVSQRGIHVGCIAVLELLDSNGSNMIHSGDPYMTKGGATAITPLSVAAPVELKRGETLSISSSPFGLVSPGVFQNSLTTGIVSNIVRIPHNNLNGNEDRASAASHAANLILTDARCLPGSEGGAVFNGAGELIGMVAPAVQRGDKSKVELGAVIPLSLFADRIGLSFEFRKRGNTSANRNALVTLNELSNFSASPAKLSTPTYAEQQLILQRRFNPQIGKPIIPLTNSESAVATSEKVGLLEYAVQQACRSVVLISVNSSWGSGIVVSEQGHILSCAHLFRPFTSPDRETKRLRLRNPRTRVKVVFRDQPQLQEYTAQLLFCSRGAIDVALLKLDVEKNGKDDRTSVLQPGSCAVELSERGPQPGQKCIALGHAIFDPSTQLMSTASAGVISKVVPHPRDNREPAILQTCASVFRGHSGGMLSDSQGRFMGILTSNARHSNGSIIPTINFSIPLAMLTPLIELANLDAVTMEANLAAVCDAYDRDDPPLLALWRLEGGAPPPVDDAVSSQNDTSLRKQENSRFAEFLNQFGSKL